MPPLNLGFSDPVNLSEIGEGEEGVSDSEKTQRVLSKSCSH